MSIDLSKIAFDSRQNYMKRGFSGSADLTLGAAGATTTHTVSHDLGYIPIFMVGAELDDTSIIYSNNLVHEATQSSAGGANIPVQVQFWPTTTTLTINIINGSGTGTRAGTRTVHWVIYLDYGSS